MLKKLAEEASSEAAKNAKNLANNIEDVDQEMEIKWEPNRDKCEVCWTTRIRTSFKVNGNRFSATETKDKCVDASNRPNFINFCGLDSRKCEECKNKKSKNKSKD